MTALSSINQMILSGQEPCSPWCRIEWHTHARARAHTHTHTHHTRMYVCVCVYICIYIYIYIGSYIIRVGPQWLWNTVDILLQNTYIIKHTTESVTLYINPSSTVSWSTALQAGRSWFRFPIGELRLTSSFRPQCGRWVDSASNRNEYQGFLLGG